MIGYVFSATQHRNPVPAVGPRDTLGLKRPDQLIRFEYETGALIFSDGCGDRAKATFRRSTVGVSIADVPALLEQATEPTKTGCVVAWLYNQAAEYLAQFAGVNPDAVRPLLERGNRKRRIPGDGTQSSGDIWRLADWRDVLARWAVFIHEGCRPQPYGNPGCFEFPLRLAVRATVAYGWTVKIDRPHRYGPFSQGWDVVWYRGRGIPVTYTGDVPNIEGTGYRNTRMSIRVTPWGFDPETGAPCRLLPWFEHGKNVPKAVQQAIEDTGLVNGLNVYTGKEIDGPYHVVKPGRADASLPVPQQPALSEYTYKRDSAYPVCRPYQTDAHAPSNLLDIPIGTVAYAQ